MPLLRVAYAIALGDSILLAGMVMKAGIKIVPCRSDYLKSVKDMYANNPEIEVYPDYDTVKFDPRWNPLGFTGDEPGPCQWYQSFGVPFNHRWDSSPIPSLIKDIEPANESVVFIHDDRSRNFVIPMDGYRPPMTESIFDHVPMIKASREIHCMDSAFFQFIESMPEINARLFYYPTIKIAYKIPFRQAWKIVAL